MCKQLNTWPRSCLPETPQGNNHIQWMHDKYPEYSWCLLWPRLLAISFQIVYLHYHPKTKQELLWYPQILLPNCSLEHPWKINREGYKLLYSIPSSSVSFSLPKPTGWNHSKVNNWCWIISHPCNPSRIDKMAQNKCHCIWYCPVFPILKPGNHDWYYQIGRL